MIQHASNDAIGALPVFGDLFEVAGQHLDRFVDFGARVLVEPGDRRSRSRLQLIQQFDRETGKVINEVQRVLDLVRDPGGELPQ